MPFDCHSCPYIVIPAKAGIQLFQVMMCSPFVWNDAIFEFYDSIKHAKRKRL